MQLATRVVLVLAITGSMLAIGPVADAATSGYGCTMHVWAPAGSDNEVLFRGSGQTVCSQKWSYIYTNVDIYGASKDPLTYNGNLYPMPGANGEDAQADASSGEVATAIAFCMTGGKFEMATDVNGQPTYREDGGAPYALLEIWSSRVIKSCNLDGLDPTHPF